MLHWKFMFNFNFVDKLRILILFSSFKSIRMIIFIKLKTEFYCISKKEKKSQYMKYLESGLKLFPVSSINISAIKGFKWCLCNLIYDWSCGGCVFFIKRINLVLLLKMLEFPKNDFISFWTFSIEFRFKILWWFEFYQHNHYSAFLWSNYRYRLGWKLYCPLMISVFY